MRKCPTFIGYSVSSDGKNVVSHRKRKRLVGVHGGTMPFVDYSYSRPCKPQVSKKGYLTVSVSDGKKSRPVGVHQLVADAFIGPCRKGDHVRHLNGDPSDNRPDNLAYGSALQNAGDRQSHGRYASGERHFNAKLSQYQADEIRLRRKDGDKVLDLSLKFGVSVSTIESVIYNRSYKVEFNVIKP